MSEEDWYELLYRTLVPEYSYYTTKIRKIKTLLRRKQLTVVNAVFKAKLPYKLNLVELHKFILRRHHPDCKFYRSQPQMLTMSSCNKKLKLIFFKSGKFRLMGKFHPIHTVASRSLRRSFSKWLPTSIFHDMMCSDMHKQTSTVVFKLNSNVIDLQAFFDFLRQRHHAMGYCELESFPAIALKNWSPFT